jgi:prepilin-type N-terminal cleavage/methylation domain-containing protein
MKIHSPLRDAFSLMELIAVLGIVGLLATVILPRLTSGTDSADAAACHTQKGDIEIQAELWKYNTGAWPAANQSTIGADLNYFPSGMATCPVDNSSYSIDTNTGRVIGHNH